MSSYLVLARKYRPESFQEMVGQQHVVRTLTNALQQGRLAHAFLFSGPRGVGKTTTARLLAKSLNCEKGPTITPCNECSFCRGIADGNAIDVYEIDGASNNSVDDIRSLRENVQYNPSQSKFKIYIIDEVHMLSTSAFNALLKTLEEPPAHVKFIFATTEVHKIPITIISRCQHFEFSLLSLREIMDSCSSVLEKEALTITKPALRMIARAAEGSLRDSQSLLEQVINLAEGKIDIADVQLALGSGDPTLLFNILQSILSGDLSETLINFDKIVSTGYDIYQFSKDLMLGFRTILIVKLVKDPTQILDITDDELKEYKKLAKQADQDQLEFCLHTLIEMENQLKRASQPRFILEVLLSKICRYASLVPVNEILKKLDELRFDNPEGVPPTADPFHTAHEKNNSPESENQELTDTEDVQSNEQSEPPLPPLSEQNTEGSQKHSSLKTDATEIQPSLDVLEHEEDQQSEEDLPLASDKSEHDRDVITETNEDGIAEEDEYAERDDEELEMIDSFEPPVVPADESPEKAREEVFQQTEPDTLKTRNESTSLAEAVLENQPRPPGDHHSEVDDRKAAFSPEQIDSTWRMIVKTVKKQKIALGTILESVFVISLNKEIWELGIKDTDTYSMKVVEDAAIRKTISTAAEEIFGYSPQISVIQVAETFQGYSIVQEDLRKKQERFAELEVIAKKETFVQQSLDLFGGKIITINEKEAQ